MQDEKCNTFSYRSKVKHLPRLLPYLSRILSDSKHGVKAVQLSYIGHNERPQNASKQRLRWETKRGKINEKV